MDLELLLRHYQLFKSLFFHYPPEVPLDLQSLEPSSHHLLNVNYRVTALLEIVILGHSLFIAFEEGLNTN